MTEEKNTKDASTLIKDDEKKKEKPEQKETEKKVVEDGKKEVKKTKEKSDKKEQVKNEKKSKNEDEEINFEEKDEKIKPSEDDDLPEDIKKKLEKNKIERAKKKHIKRKKRKSAPKKVSSGRAYIKATYNNTVITLTDLQGNVISWASAGIAGFKGPKKATPYAAQIIVKIAVMKAKEEYGLEEVSVYVKGVGTGRESAIRALNANGLNVTFIKDITPIPHNGCRPKGPRRV
jgi:small subunit ribosomal protein S11